MHYHRVRTCDSLFVLLQMFYINPLTWAFRAAVLNEFQSPEYDVCATEQADGEDCPKALGQVQMLLFMLLFVVAVVAEFWRVCCF